jgi:hypothetical protein
MAPLQYLPLESSSYFRVLYVNPGEDGEKLSGRLIHCDFLVATPPLMYDCLSYVWGSSILSHEISIEGFTLSITANLDSALRRLRKIYLSESMPIWADGICINREDNSERNQQVALMKRIYSECLTGTIYLGETADESDLVPEFLEILAESAALLLRREKNPTKWGPENEHAFPHVDHPGWRRFVALLNRPWFQRVWIIQEFALPPELRMICSEWKIAGTYLSSLLTIPLWKYSHSVATALTDQPANGASSDTVTTLALRPLHLQIRYGQGRALGLGTDSLIPTLSDEPATDVHRSLVWLLRKTPICQSTDPRNKIFGIVSLAAAGTECIADYSEGVEGLAVRFGKHLVRTGYGLSLLLSSACLNGAVGLPSWLPSWTRPHRATFAVWPDRYEKCLDCCIGVNAAGQTITVRGYFIDTAQTLAYQWKTKLGWTSG